MNLFKNPLDDMDDDFGDGSHNDYLNKRLKTWPSMDRFYYIERVVIKRLGEDTPREDVINAIKLCLRKIRHGMKPSEAIESIKSLDYKELSVSSFVPHSNRSKK